MMLLKLDSNAAYALTPYNFLQLLLTSPPIPALTSSASLSFSPLLSSPSLPPLFSFPAASPLTIIFLVVCM